MKSTLGIFIVLFMIISGITFIIYAQGSPAEKIHFYNNDTIVCRDRNKEWSLTYTEHQCWHAVEIPLDGHIGLENLK